MSSGTASTNSSPPPMRSAYVTRRLFVQIPLTAVFAGAIPLLPRPAAAAEAAALKIIAFGDSLIAGPGLPADATFPAVLEKALRAAGHKVTVVNAGVSGDTAFGGLTRLDWAIADGADGLILELGANDMMRGIDTDVTRGALDGILAKLKQRNIKALIAGMKASPSLGQDYKARFDTIYPELAVKYQALLYPFYLEGVAANPSLTLGDGLHPNAAGVEHIVKAMLPLVLVFLQQMDAASARRE